MLSVQEVPMCEKKSIKCKSFPGEEKKRSGAVGSPEEKNRGIGEKEQIVRRREFNIEGNFRLNKKLSWPSGGTVFHP